MATSKRPNDRGQADAVSVRAPVPGARTSVRIDEEMSADLAVLKSAGFTVTEALREGVRILAEVHANAWAAGVRDRQPVAVVSATAEPVSDSTPKAEE